MKEMIHLVYSLYKKASLGESSWPLAAVNWVYMCKKKRLRSFRTNDLFLFTNVLFIIDSLQLERPDGTRKLGLNDATRR